MLINRELDSGFPRPIMGGSGGLPLQELGDPRVDRQPLIKQWRDFPRREVPYSGGVYPDGTPYSAGVRLLIGREGEEMETMNSFEEPWCKATVETMFAGKEGPLTVVERGFGLGIMSKYILQEMLSRGGEYHIIELNEKVYGDAVDWAKSKQRPIDRLTLPSSLKIHVHLGDADQVLLSFQQGYFDLIFSDTHQLTEDERGINDLLALEELKRKLKPDGRFTFCAFHRNNQTGNLDSRQYVLVTSHFKNYRVSTVELTPPPDCTYLERPKSYVPVVVCENPKPNGELLTAA